MPRFIRWRSVKKIYEPVPMSEAGLLKHPLRMRLKELAPLRWFCFVSRFHTNPDLQARHKTSIPMIGKHGLVLHDDAGRQYQFRIRPPTSPNLRFISCIVATLSPTIALNFGDHVLRTILFWWLLANRTGGLLMMQIWDTDSVVKADTTNKDTITDAAGFAICMQMGGLVIDNKKAAIEWGTVAASTDGSTSQKIFNEFCNAEVSKDYYWPDAFLKAVAYGTWAAGPVNNQRDIRDDIRQQDSMKLRDTLRKQGVLDFLRVNGYRGNAPMVYWGGCGQRCHESFKRFKRGCGRL